MDWISLHYLGLILQQERLQRAREPLRGYCEPMLHKWLRALRRATALRSPGDRPPSKIAQAGGPALPRDGAPA